ncbi:MAG: Zn-ribbon domain-containing OB-fold protein [Candidatus Micrarchaeota archaeon]|nr:Zn-ribbon domain-containing OB-fold protein [Candidatus Micrarchaeota archaeon]
MSEFAVPFHWRNFKSRYNLIGSRCSSCGKYFYPERSICPICKRTVKMEKVKFSGKGRVFTYTVIRVPPEGFSSYAPYIVAIIELEEGVKITGQIVDCEPEDVEIGMPVEAVFRKMRSEKGSGIILYGTKFKPA